MAERERSTAAIVFRSAVFTLLVPGTVAGWVPWWLARATGATLAGAAPWRWLGVVPLAAGLAIYGWCVTDFARAGRGTPAPIDPPRALVVRGLYRYTRNPMYVGVLAVLAGEAWLLGSAAHAVWAAAVFALFHAFVVGYEEPALARRFGAAYAQYCEAVPRWLVRRREP